MLRIAISELTTYRWTFEQDVSEYSRHGFDGIGIWRQKLAECGEDKGVDLLCEAALDVSSLTWVGGFTGSDGRSFEASVEDAIEALRLAAAVRAECLVVYTGARGGHTRRHSLRLVRRALGHLVDAAEDLGVTLAVKPMHPGVGLEWTFLSNLDATLELLDEFPSVGMVFDTYQWACADNILEYLPNIAHRTALVQLGDACQLPCGEPDRRPLGEGGLPLREIVTTLVEHGYEGFLEIELMGPEIETRDYHALLKQTRDAAADFASVQR